MTALLTVEQAVRIRNAARQPDLAELQKAFAEVLVEFGADVDTVIDAIEETFLDQLPSKAMSYCAQEDVNAGLDALRERFQTPQWRAGERPT